jgi:hypothetical protein
MRIRLRILPLTFPHILTLQCSKMSLYGSHLFLFDADPDTDPAFHFDADPNPVPAFHFDADPDPAPQNDVDPDPLHCFQASS